MTVLDRNGKELAVGDRVRRRKLLSDGWCDDRVVAFCDESLGGPVVRTTAMPRLPTISADHPGTSRCPDLELLPTDPTDASTSDTTAMENSPGEAKRANPNPRSLS